MPMETEFYTTINRDRLYQNMSNIIKYLRISRDLNQTDISKILGCSRSKASRIENGLTNPDVHEWHSFTNYFGLSLNCYIHSNIEAEYTNDLKTFKIMAPYSENLYSGGKILNMHIEAFKSLMGEKAFTEFCQIEKVNPLYFVNIKNSLSANFNLRLLQTLIAKNAISSVQQIQNYSRLAIQTLNQNPFGNVYQSSHGIYRILDFFKNSDLYESNHEYTVFNFNPNKYIVCGFKPREHVDMNLYNGAFLKGVCCQFLNFCVMEIAGPSVESEKLTCIHNNDPYCSYKYNTSSSEVCS